MGGALVGGVLGGGSLVGGFFEVGIVVGCIKD